MYGAEFASGVSFGLWGVFGNGPAADATVLPTETNLEGFGTATGVDQAEIMQLAYQKRWPGLYAETTSVFDRHNAILASGEDPGWFVNGLRGQLAEFNAAHTLEVHGHTEVQIAEDPNQQGWDLSSNSPAGEETLNQVKTGSSHSYGDFRDHMNENPDVDTYVVSNEAYDSASRAADSMQDGPDRDVIGVEDSGLESYVVEGLDGPPTSGVEYPFEVGTQVHNMLNHGDSYGSSADFENDYAEVEGIEDGLSTISENLGIDVPDGLVDIVPYAAAIIGGARLVYSVIKTEKEFKAADRTTKNKIQVMQTLTLMSRMGVTSVLATAGGVGGGAIGSAVPGVGNLVGGVVGTVTGAGMGMYLNRHLQPHMLNLALDITGLTNDDLFYYKNKVRVDGVAVSYQNTSRELAALPAW